MGFPFQTPETMAADAISFPTSAAKVVTALRTINALPKNGLRQDLFYGLVNVLVTKFGVSKAMNTSLWNAIQAYSARPTVEVETWDEAGEVDIPNKESPKPMKSDDPELNDMGF